MTAYAYQILNALGDPTRRLVFMRLRGGARSVGEIADTMDVSRPAVSQHLKILKTAHLVTDRADGTRRVYAVDQRGINSLRSWLDGFWDQALTAFKEAAEEEASKGKKNMRRRRRSRIHEVRTNDVLQCRPQ